MTVELINEIGLNTGDDQKNHDFTSPFTEEIAAITENLRIISSKFVLEESQTKGKMLRLSVLQNLIGLEKSESTKIIAGCFSENFLDNEIYKINNREDKSILKIPDGKFAEVKESGIISSQNKNYNVKPYSQEYSFNIHFSNTIDILLDIFTNFIEGFLQFRQEFFGVTKYYILPTGSLEIKVSF